MTVDDFVNSKVLPEYRDVVQALRRLIRDVAKGASEEISYGIPVYKLNRAFVVISPTKTAITLAFSRGAEFGDRHGLLRGVGKVSKHIKIKRVEDVPVAAIKDYLRQALALDAQPTHSRSRRKPADRQSLK